MSARLQAVPTQGEDAHAAQAGGRSIKVERVSKVFRRGRTRTHALDAIDFEVGEGEFLGIVGPSGCGKSTLLRLISGIMQASSGRIELGGKTVAEPQSDCGIVFQKPILLEWRKTLENVLLQVEMRKLDARDYVDRARQLLAAVGLSDFEDRYPHELSGGMQQRAAIARALLHDPPLLLMDEPFGALDALTREQLRVDLEELWLNKPKTVVFITHSIDEAVLLSDRVIVMSPRPGTVERIVPIELDRPRGLAARKQENFDRAVEEITEIFLSRGVLHSAHKAPSLVEVKE